MQGMGHCYPQQQQQQQMPVQHHNPVIAAMLAQSNLLQTSSHCPVLHATMAALSNQGACTCVYCVTSSSRKQQQQGLAAGLGGASAHKPGITPAQLASLAMPPPRPVVMSGKPAAAAAAAAAAAPGSAMPVSSTSMQQQHQQQQGCGPAGGASLSNVTSSSSLATYGAFDNAALKSSSTSQFTTINGGTAFAGAAGAAVDWGAQYNMSGAGMGLQGLDNTQAAQQQQQQQGMHGAALAN
jgi:hypothetical protein